MPAVTEKKNRLITLDYLRGFFIVIIIVDHFSRWPSLLEFLSGRALLWVTAAEGFVTISGLLVGYIRGFKNKADSMATVTKKLLKRAGLLYLWTIIASVAYTAILWYVPLIGGAPTMPVEKGEWFELIVEIVTLHYTFLWVHFLMLYALFLAAAPIAVWLLRRGLAWVVITLSIVILCIGWLTHSEPLQWQVLFFIPSVAGYYLPEITSWWHKLTTVTRRAMTIGLVSLTALTIIISVICTYAPGSIQTVADTLNAQFAKDAISPWRALMAFTWFTGFVLIFQLLEKYIGRWFGWLLLPFGTRSLTAYILHGLAIVLISYFTLGGENLIENTLLGVLCILIVWGLLKIPFIHKLVPS